MRNALLRSGAVLGAVVIAATLAGCMKSTEILPERSSGIRQPSDFASVGGVPPEGQRRSFARHLGGGAPGAGIPVNGFLWRAALDTVSFMPLASADAYGGAIITDWYAPPETPDERFKVNVLVQGMELRSDGLKVTVFRQTRADGGAWKDAPVDNNMAVDLENVILNRARQLRQDAVNR